MTGRTTPKKSTQAPPPFIPLAWKLRDATDKAVDEMPRTPIERLARGMRRSPGLKALREGILKRDADG